MPALRSQRAWLLMSFNLCHAMSSRFLLGASSRAVRPAAIVHDRELKDDACGPRRMAVSTQLNCECKSQASVTLAALYGKAYDRYKTTRASAKVAISTLSVTTPPASQADASAEPRPPPPEPCIRHRNSNTEQKMWKSKLG